MFQTAAGENIPYSAEMISVEIMGETAELFDADFIKHAAAAVFHYFRDEQGRETVTVAEFSLALEKILRGFNLAAAEAQLDNPAPRVAQSDLCRLASESHEAGELFFFPLLRDELRAQLQQSPQLLCFQGLRAVCQATRRRAPLEQPLPGFARSDCGISPLLHVAGKSRHQLRVGGKVKLRIGHADSL